MLAVLEKSLPPFSRCDLSVDDINAGLPPAPRYVRTPANAAEDFVPAAPVRLPQIKRLDQPHALAQARSSVNEALDDLRSAEKALQQRLRRLRLYIDKNVSVA